MTHDLVADVSERITKALEEHFANARTIPVSTKLFGALQAAGIEAPEDGDRLSDAQWDRLVANRDIAERMELVETAAVSGVLPASRAPNKPFRPW